MIIFTQHSCRAREVIEVYFGNNTISSFNEEILACYKISGLFKLSLGLSMYLFQFPAANRTKVATRLNMLF